VLKGQSLRGGDTRVLVGGVEISGGALAISNEQITVTLPGTVRAGVQAVQVKQYLEMGTPPAAHRGYESNVVAIVLQPEITKTGANYNITIVPPAGDQPRKLRIGVNPVVEPTQRAELLLNELNAPATRPPFAFALPAELRAPGSAPVAELTFPIGTVPAGDYLVRLRIDGADSPLDLDPVQGYTGPVQTL
jgi:hypothetical protein